MLFIISITTTFAQNEVNTLYLSGQAVNLENGAPLSFKEVFIQSDVAVSGGMSYTLSVITDENGFFYDTITTTAIKGSLSIYAFDINEIKHEVTEYFRFNWEDTYYCNTELEVYDPVTNDFQANFYPTPDTASMDDMTINFTDESTASGVVTWYWDFGDGHHSIEQNPKHEYAAPGLYDVSLSISTEHLASDIFTSTIVKKIKVGMKAYYDFGGQAFAGYFPVDMGIAYLYKIEEDVFIPIDTSQFDEYGFYYFRTLIAGEYKVKTFPSPNSAHAGSYLPTYYGNELLWTKAKNIKLQETGWNYDISMIQNTAYNSGSGNIEGIVFLEGKEDVVGNAEVILFNELNNCLTYIKSDDKGVFEFNGLPYGTYSVLADVPGKYAYPATIILSTDNPTIDVNVVLYDEDIYYGIEGEDLSSLSSLSDPYPNPARTSVKVEFNLLESGQVQVFILNQGGQIVDKYSANHQSGENHLRMNTSNLSSGMYKMMILFGNEKHVKTFIKVN
jgi:PKD repeat protein